MLPHQLSNGCCSLNEKEDRLALSCLMTFDKNGKLIDHDICESVINSKHRMTYDSVYKIMKQDEKEREIYSDISEMIDRMYDLSKILRKKRNKRGAINFDFPETYFDSYGILWFYAFGLSKLRFISLSSRFGRILCLL